MDKDDMDEMDALEDEISALEEKLERYRKALLEIADHNVHGFTQQTEIAKDALVDA